MSTPVTKAQTYLSKGIIEHEAFTKSFREAKRHALQAGFYFIGAQQSTDNFDELIRELPNKISRATIYRYIQFTTEVLAWAAAEHTKYAKDQSKLLLMALDMVMQSPKGYVALCRELQLMRKFGEYDEVRYRTRKLGQGQIEFDFGKILPVFDVLEHFGEENFVLQLPDGKDQATCVAELEAKLETALKRVRQFKKNGGPIDA